MIELEKDRLYTAREVAKILRCKDTYIQYLVRTKQIEAYVNGRMYLFDRGQINSYLENNKVGANS